jgi:pilus assembly protein CpaC
VPAAKPAPIKKPVQTAASTPQAPTAKPVSAATSTAPSAAAVVAASDRKGASKGGVKELQPTASENPAAGGSLIARGSKNGAPNIMRVLTGKSIMVDLAKDSKRVAVANPKVAEVLIITPKQVMVNGLSDGETSIIIWDRSGNYTMSTVVVGDDLADQVMLDVTVAEINRSAMERHGVDYRNFGGQFKSISQYGGVSPVGGSYPPSASDPPFPISLDGGISWAIIDAKNDIALIFKQLQDDNLGRVLAEPKLLSRSGKEANFLSGGEIPIVITTNDDTSIEFKEFGTKVDFTPSVREDGTIDLKLATEVSEPDYSAGVQLFGFTVPAFVTRRTNTEVSLRDNQSLIVAGLIKETKQEIESKMPFMGDVPVLGYFFKKTEFQNDILELVMVVRPRLVHPIASGTRVSLPTDRGPLTRQEVRTGPVEEKVTRPRPY